MTRLTDRLERDLREIAGGAQPSLSAWESITARFDEDAEGAALEPVPAATTSTRRVWPAVAAAAVLVGITASIAMLARPGDDESISTADPSSTTTFVSPRNGFSLEHFDRGDGTVTPAEQLWGFGEQVDDGFDVIEIGVDAVFKGASTAFPGDGPCLSTEYEPIACGSIDEQVDRYLDDDTVLPDGCGVPRSQQAEIAIDGQSGRLAECPNHIEASVVVGGRLYLFTLSHDRSDARDVFDDFVATIDLRPETAVDFPGLTSSFVSPTYGYSFRYHDRGGLQPAEQRWDPVAGQPDEHPSEDWFDAVETGLSAYFQGASAPIPDAASIDAWIDDHVSPAGCGIARREQAEITIDGEPGRVAECANRVEATVVAGGRLYVFSLDHERRDARAFFDAWIATIDLTPETAA